MTELANIESGVLSPMEMVKGGQEVADALMDVVNRSKGKLAVTISGREYVRVEGWIFIGRAFNTFAATEYVLPMHSQVDGQIEAYQAKVNLMRDGIMVGAAISECGIDGEYATQGRSGRSAHAAAKSMAQTRATSKAFRMTFAWVAVLAGYEPTTAEEVEGPVEDPQIQYPCTLGHKGQYWTEKTNPGGGRWYSHPLGSGWCNMPANQRPDRADEEAEEEQAWPW